MTDEQLIQFTKESIQVGKGFAPTQTELLTKYGKSMGEANRILELAKEELGMSADTTEDDIRQAKYLVIGEKINLLSWLIFFASILIIWLAKDNDKLGYALFFLAITLSGVAIYLRERTKWGFIHLSGIAAKSVGILLAIGGLMGILDSCK